MIAAVPEITTLLKVLGDSTRLRILALIEAEELSVGELSRALAMSQSRVSNHLRLLRRASLLTERHAGSSTFLRLAQLNAVTDPVWQALRPRLAALPEHRADRMRLQALFEERAQRSHEFFDAVAADWDKLGIEFETGQARQRAAAALLAPDMVVADIGCGTGYMAHALLGLAARVICVDRSRAMLAQAEQQLARDSRGTRVEFRHGELDHLPIEDGELDGLVAGMVLHHLADIDAAVLEMRRALKPGATAAVLELAPHDQGWMRETLGDRHLGLEPAGVVAAFERAGFESVQLDPLADHYRPHLPANAAGEERAHLPMYMVRARAPRLP